MALANEDNNTWSTRPDDQGCLSVTMKDINMMSSASQWNQFLWLPPGLIPVMTETVICYRLLVNGLHRRLKNCTTVICVGTLKETRWHRTMDSHESTTSLLMIPAR